MEENNSHLEYTKWEEEKIRFKTDGGDMIIEGLIRFYTILVNIEENPKYVGKQGTHIDTNELVIRSINSYYAWMKPQSHEKKRNDYGNKQNKGNDSQGKPRIQYQPNRNVAQSSDNGGQSKPRYYIFCETNTRDTGFCIISKYTADYKSQQCLDHNACYMCFNTSENKGNTCSKIMKYRLYPRMHHFNNHRRKEISDYYKKKKRSNKP